MIIHHIGIGYRNSKVPFKIMKRIELVKITGPKYFSKEEAMYEILKMINNEALKVHVEQKKVVKENNVKLYSFLWSNSTYKINTKIKSSTKYQNMKDDHNVISLLNYTETITLNCEDQLYPY